MNVNMDIVKVEGSPWQSSSHTCPEQILASWRWPRWPWAGPSSPCPPSWALNPPKWRHQCPWKPLLPCRWGWPLLETKHISCRNRDLNIPIFWQHFDEREERQPLFVSCPQLFCKPHTHSCQEISVFIITLHHLNKGALQERHDKKKEMHGLIRHTLIFKTSIGTQCTQTLPASVTLPLNINLRFISPNLTFFFILKTPLLPWLWLLGHFRAWRLANWGIIIIHGVNHDCPYTFCDHMTWRQSLSLQLKTKSPTQTLWFFLKFWLKIATTLMKVTEAWHLKETYGIADWPTMQLFLVVYKLWTIVFIF